MGHLVRSLTLAEYLAAEFRVRLLNGGRLPRRMKVPGNVEIVNLAPLGFDENNQLVSRDKRRSVVQAQLARKQKIMEVYQAEKPEIVFVELFPFGRKKFADELLPLLNAAKGRSKIICSVRDILVTTRENQVRHDERAVEIANKFFDAILVHSDPSFVRFDESVRSSTPLRVPIFYTGFVAPEFHDPPAMIVKGNGIKKIVVSAGGGLVGKHLIQTAVEAHKLLSTRQRIQTTIAAGLFLPEAEWQELREGASFYSGIRLKRFIPDLRREMARSDVSVSQCGYNTALDIVSSRVPAIVVPFGDGVVEDEQTKRGELLQKLGVVKVCSDPTPGQLAHEIEIALESQRSSGLSLDVNGGPASTEIVKGLIRQRRESNTSWLDPVVSALELRKSPVKVFFRDDDAGIGNERLFKLMSIFEAFDMPLDIAVIPKEVSRSFADRLRKRINSRRDLFFIHQHGYAHRNHEMLNRKSEFGSARNKRQQSRDIDEGRKLLSILLGDMPLPIFTPPWNRCTRETSEVLTELGFKVLSRESRAERITADGLCEVPVSVDWFAKRKGTRLTRSEVGHAIANAVSSQDRVGIMLHHELMDEKERALLKELFTILANSNQVEKRSIWNLYLEEHANGAHSNNA